MLRQPPTSRRRRWARLEGAGLRGVRGRLVERPDRFYRDPPPAAVARQGRPIRHEGTNPSSSRAAWYLAEGSLVTILGPGVNAADRDGRGSGVRFASRHGRARPARSPSASTSSTTAVTCRGLAAHRARRGAPGPAQGTAGVLLTPRPTPSPTSGIAFSPAATKRHAPPRREAYPLILTTSYRRRARAGVRRREPTVRPRRFPRQTGPHRARFLHIPWWDGGLSAPHVITAPNEYLGFPVHDATHSRARSS